MADDMYYLLTDRHGDIQKCSVVLGIVRRMGLANAESNCG